SRLAGQSLHTPPARRPAALKLWRTAPVCLPARDGRAFARGATTVRWMTMADRGLRIAASGDDPLLYDVDDEFRDLLVELSALAAASKVRRSRFFHPASTSALGWLEVGDGALPAHSFFRPGRRFRVLGRYSNAFAADDIAPSVRGLTLRLFSGDPPAG